MRKIRPAIIACGGRMGILPAGVTGAPYESARTAKAAKVARRVAKE